MRPHLYACMLTQGCLDTVTEKSPDDDETHKKWGLFEGAVLRCDRISFQEPDDFTGSTSLIKYSAEEEEEEVVQGLRRKRVCWREVQPLMWCKVKVER